MASDRARPPLPLRMLATVAALVLVLLTLAGWLLGTASGAHAAFAALESMSAGALRAEGVHGRLGGPLRLDQLILDQQNRRITFTDLKLDWRPLALLHSTLAVTSLDIGHVSILNQPDQKPQPARLPDRIGLPLDLQVADVRIGSGDVANGQTSLLRFGPLAFRLDFDGGRYRLQLKQLAVANGALAAGISGGLTLSATSPYPLQGNFSGHGDAMIDGQAIASSGRARLSGSLADLGLALDFTANHATLTGNAALHPFSDQPLGAARLDAQALDLALFDQRLPHTALDLRLAASDAGAGKLSLKNSAAGPYDQHKLPLAALDIDFQRQADVLDLEHIVASLGTPKQAAGQITGSGRLDGGALTLALHVAALDLKRLDGRARTTSLNGDIGLHNAAGQQEFTVALNEPLNKRRIALDAHGLLANSVLTLDRLALQAGSGRIEATAQMALNGDRHFRAEGRINRFRLRELGDFPQLPSLDLNGGFLLQGTRQPQLRADLTFDIRDSRLAGQPLVGNGAVQLRDDRLTVKKFLLASGANRLNIDGQLSQGGTQLSFDLKAPQLAQLGPGFAGALSASGVVRGSIGQPHIHAEWQADHAHLPGQLQVDTMHGKAELGFDRTQPFPLRALDAEVSARGLRLGANRIDTASAQLRFAPPANAPLALTLQAQGIATSGLLANRITVSASGTTAHHTIRSTLDETGQAWKLDAQGGFDQFKNAPRWQGSIRRFDADGRFHARLASPAPLLLSAQRTQLDHFVLDAGGGRIAIEQFTRDKNGIVTRGQAQKLQLAELLRHLQPAPPVRTDLRLSGEWDVRIGAALRGDIRLRRDDGDVTVLGSSPVTLGLRTLDASASAAGGRLTLRLRLDGSRLGQVNIDAVSSIGDARNRLAIAADAPLSGSMHVDVPSLAWIAPLVSPALIADGRLQGDAVLGGSFGTPSLAGRIAGSGLRLSFTDLGLDLREGTLQSEFQGDRLLIQNLRFQSGSGHIALAGPINLSGGEIGAQLTLEADHYRLLNRVDRRLVLSGNSQIVLRDRRASATGEFTVNSGAFDIGSTDRPHLSDDVVIVGQQDKQPAKLATALDIRIGLGDGVKLTGRGLDGTLVGAVRLRNDPGEALQAHGTLGIINGTYTAYGRELKIEQGELRFNGSLSDPSLSILAMRRGQEVAAGVSVRGTVLAPRVTLVSDPELPDAEKLSWLVLGHGLASAGASDAGALQNAAGALLSEGAAAGVQSRIASAFGLDTFSVGTSQDSLQQRIVTLGKQLSSRLYLSYQQGLQSAGSVVQLRYLLTPKLSVEAEAGARSAVSLFYNIAFD